MCMDGKELNAKDAKREVAKGAQKKNLLCGLCTHPLRPLRFMLFVLSLTFN